MPTVLQTNTSHPYDLLSKKTWADLISVLRRYARHSVYSAHVVCWHGQEEDIVEDIVQETMHRILERSQKAERGEALPIYSFEHMLVRIARNYFIDRLRRDRRLQRVSSDGFFLEGSSTTSDQISLFETAIECVHQEELFTQIAHEITHFPKMQRRALLIDLANRMYFGRQLTRLQKAFLAEGINLQEYQQPLSNDKTERARQAALASLAYKRVAMLIHEYTLDM